MPADSPIANELEIRVTGMSRSGNHAIINWILRQAPPHYCFLNCTEPKYNPYETARPLSENGPCFLSDIAGLDLEGDRLAKKNLLVYSHEDIFLGPLGDPRWDRCRDQWVGRSRRRIDLLILRDPFNLFASRFQFGLSWQPARHTPFSALSRRIWQQHARQFLGERQHFPGEWLALSYNRWTLDRRYRQQIARWIGFPFTDSGFEEIPECAGGSSFDGTSPSSPVLRRQVHDRWRVLAKEPAYRKFFDSTTCDLAHRCFPGSDVISEHLLDAAEAPCQQVTPDH